MSKLPVYELSAQVDKVLVVERISSEELEAMVSQAAITTHERGNRRFHHWIFKVVGNRVERMTYLEETHVIKYHPSRGGFSVAEEHELCDGQGCICCGHIGMVSVTYRAATSKRIERRGRNY